jgi:hypothetical protein
VQRASGIPCALSFERCENYLQTSGDQRREIANLYLDLLIARRFEQVS